MCAFACAFWVYWFSANSPPSTVTPLALISNIQSKRTSALKINTNRTRYVTPLLYMKKNTSHVPTIPFFKLKISRENAISMCIEIPLLFHCPSYWEKKLNKNPPQKKKNVESNSVTGGTAVPCTVRITANCCGWIIAISANYGGAGLFKPRKLSPTKVRQRWKCHGQPTPPPKRGI